MEREREREKEEKWYCGVKNVSVGFKKGHAVTLSPTTKIFVLENELTNKETTV